MNKISDIVNATNEYANRISLFAKAGRDGEV